MWTRATRAQHTRVSNRYQNDLTDAEWELIVGLLPLARSTGRPRAWPLREIMNAIFYVLRGAIAWRLLPRDLPPWPRLSGWILVAEAHGVDSNWVQRVSRLIWTRKGTCAARHLNTVFHNVQRLVSWSAFDKLVDQHGADDLVRRFTTRQQFKALLFGQLSGASSLRDLITTMGSHCGRLYHCGAAVPKRSTLADANRLRSSAVFSELFKTMLAGRARGLRRKMTDAVRLIDSTSLLLAGAGAQ